MLARGALAFGLGFAAGAVFVAIGPTGPMWLLRALQRVLDLWWLGVLLIVLGVVLRARLDRVYRLAYLGAAWIGFPVGFLVVGAVSCAFCLE